MGTNLTSRQDIVMSPMGVAEQLGISTSGNFAPNLDVTKPRGRAHINLLEFIAQLISIWINKS